MTLSVLENHSPIASLFKCDISYLWHVMQSFSICRASCKCNVCLFVFSSVTMTTTGDNILDTALSKVWLNYQYSWWIYTHLPFMCM